MSFPLPKLRAWPPLDTQSIYREISHGLKLHRKLCKENVDKIQPYVEKYKDDERNAKVDVAALRAALFPENRKESGPWVWSLIRSRFLGVC